MRVRQNTIAATGDSRSRMRPSAPIFCARGSRYACWRTFGASPAFAAGLLMRMRSGFFWWRLAIASMRGGIVAEKRSEEHTSELQSQSNLVCRLLLEKKKQKKK